MQIMEKKNEKKETEPVLTIIFVVYNHEKYVLKALKSIEEQRIECTYEVIVGEDHSMDRSGEILRRYQNNAPKNWYFLYRDHNLGMLRNISDLLYRARGKYVIVLEGDDYWIYPDKLNSQIAFLEEHAEYSGCAHGVRVIDADGNDRPAGYIHGKRSGTYGVRDYLHELLPGQTASFLYRNYFREGRLFQYLNNNALYPMDRFIAFVIASKGKIRCIDQEWSAYRYITDGGSSFSATVDCNSDEYAKSALQYHRSIYAYAITENCGKDCIKVSEKLYYRSFLRDWATGGGRNLRVLFCELKKMKYPVTTLLWMVGEFFRLIIYERNRRF